MKVLFDHPDPFLLAHGGFQIQIEQTKAALEQAGVEVEWLRWWDASQNGQIIHYFGRPTAGYIRAAQQKHFRVVMAELLTGLGSRPAAARWLQRGLMQTAQNCLPATFTARMAWESYQCADAVIALTPWEAQLMADMFSAAHEKLHVVPNGVEKAFLESVPRERGPWLVCTATITPRKRVLELAEAAVHARTPLWIIGRGYSETDSYLRRFQELARQHAEWIRFEGPVQDRSQLAAIYREARGFVLLSTMESLSLSALEAAACQTSLLLSDLPWARCTFGATATYCPIAGVAATGRVLRQFYDAAPKKLLPPTPASWKEVAAQLQGIYERLLSTSR